MHEICQMTDVKKRRSSASSEDKDEISQVEEHAQLSRRDRLPFAQRITLCIYRISTAMLLMMWIYLTPNSPSAISCLIEGPNEAYMSLLCESAQILNRSWNVTKAIVAVSELSRTAVLGVVPHAL